VDSKEEEEEDRLPVANRPLTRRNNLQLQQRTWLGPLMSSTYARRQTENNL
jgi:hypothetical protein